MRKILRNRVGIALACLLLLPCISMATESGQSRDQVEEMFRAAKRMVYQQDWPAAVEKLNRLVSDMPPHARLEESLYWLAYALNQSAEKKENALEKRSRAVVHLERLLRTFPTGRWARQANSLLTDISGELASSGLKIFSRRLKKIENATDDLDIKLLALDSLMNTDSKLARKRLREILKSSKPSRQRRMALSILLQHDGLRSSGELVDIIRGDKDELMRLFALNQLVRVDFKLGLREFDRLIASKADLKFKVGALALLLNDERPEGLKKLEMIAMNGNQPEALRAHAAFWLAQRKAPGTIALIERLFSDFSQPASRMRLAQALGIMQSKEAAKALIRLFAGESDLSVRKSILMALGMTQQETARRFLQDLINH